jgi:hypothetical protein
MVPAQLSHSQHVCYHFSYLTISSSSSTLKGRSILLGPSKAKTPPRPCRPPRYLSFQSLSAWTPHYLFWVTAVLRTPGTSTCNPPLTNFSPSWAGSSGLVSQSDHGLETMSSHGHCMLSLPPCLDCGPSGGGPLHHLNHGP